MKITTAAVLINAAMWLGVSAAIIVALLITGRAAVLWFFLIPLFGTIGFKQTETHTKKENDEKEG